jgi:hypothetical protein
VHAPLANVAAAVSSLTFVFVPRWPNHMTSTRELRCASESIVRGRRRPKADPVIHISGWRQDRPSIEIPWRVTTQNGHAELLSGNSIVEASPSAAVYLASRLRHSYLWPLWHSLHISRPLQQIGCSSQSVGGFLGGTESDFVE